MFKFKFQATVNISLEKINVTLVSASKGKSVCCVAEKNESEAVCRLRIGRRSAKREENPLHATFIDVKSMRCGCDLLPEVSETTPTSLKNGIESSKKIVKQNNASTSSCDNDGSGSGTKIESIIAVPRIALRSRPVPVRSSNSFS